MFKKNSTKKKINLDLKKQKKYLRKELFLTDTKWPQYNLLFDDIKRLAKQFKKDKSIVFLERNLLYGGNSLFKPFFNLNHVTSVDCSPKKTKKRGKYQFKYIKNKNIIKNEEFNKLHCDYRKIKLKSNFADLIIIPNLIHHVAEHDKLFQECSRILKKKGKLYIFEPTLREMHQNPDDFVRFTPNGLLNVLNKNKFKKNLVKTVGGAFTASIYCLNQAIQFLPKKEKTKFNHLVSKNFFKKMVNYEKKYTINLSRRNVSFPTAFSLLVSK